MASAAAVAADVSKEDLPFKEIDEERNLIGSITSAKGHFRSAESASEPEDDDEDISSRARRRSKPNGTTSAKSQSPALNSDQKQAQEDEEAMDEDLFGDDDDDEAQAPKKKRQLQDDELDSGDDEDRDDRMVEDEEAQQATAETQEFTAQDFDLGRHPIPQPSDGELYLLKVPKFFAMEPHQFTPQTFQPPSTDHHSLKAPSDTFSAYKTAMTTIRWRKSPSNPSELQSNARVVRWSNGELTLQFASDPSTHYPVSGNTLAPAQRGAKKPTPTSKPGPIRAYNMDDDSFTYLAAPQEMAGVLRITNKLTAGLKVQAATNASDEALERLQMSLASTAKDVNGGGLSRVDITEDPERARKRAEDLEKQLMKAQKRREAAAARDQERQGRALGRSGLGRSGLTIGGLEDDDELGKGITRLPAVGRKKPRTNRRGEIYSEDEDEFNRRGRTKEDEYDEEDDFVAGSDEEEVVDDDEDEDDGIVEQPRAKTVRASPKRSAPVDDAEGDVDEDPGESIAQGSPQGRNKRRKVIEDEDDE